MQTKARRAIKSGEQYDHLFPLPKGEDTTVRLDAEVDDTLALIQKTVPLTLNDTKKIAALLKANTLEQTCQNIWNFVYDHIQYKKDKQGVEQVRRPARSWWERKTGVDCDCYTEFISSILTNLSIGHKYRITKYDYKPSYQHIYPIVPRDGDVTRTLSDRNDYIVIDCVKDNFDDEQPFTAFKDYMSMRLDYLSGLENDYSSDPKTTDMGDLSTLEDDTQLNGKFGKWIKKVGNKVKQGVRFLNRFTNPGAIMIRNGFLLAMKTNFLRIATRLRYGYLSNEQAQKMGLNMDAFAKLKKVVSKAEDIYFNVGGKKENLKKAILSGKGNRDGKVPLSGLDGLDDVYADIQEYNIIHGKSPVSGLDGEEELGVVATASVTAAMSVLGAVAAALSKVKGLFPKKSPEAKNFDADQGQATTQADNSENPTTPATDDETTQQNSSQSASHSARAAMSNRLPASRVNDSNEQAVVESKASDAALAPSNAKPEGAFSKATSWIKENPTKSLLIASALAGGAYLLLKNKKAAPASSASLGGLPKKPFKKKKTKKWSTQKPRITTIEL